MKDASVQYKKGGKTQEPENTPEPVTQAPVTPETVTQAPVTQAPENTPEPEIVNNGGSLKKGGKKNKTKTKKSKKGGKIQKQKSKKNYSKRH